MTSGEGPTNWRGARVSAATRAGDGGKGRSTYNQTGLLHVSGKLGIFGQETVALGRRLVMKTRPSPDCGSLLTWMDHLSSVLESDLDDLVAGQIGTHRGVLSSLANDVGFVGLCSRVISFLRARGEGDPRCSKQPLTLPVHAQPVLVAEDGNGVERQLVGGSEDANGDLAAVGDQQLLQVHDGAVGADVVHRLGLLGGHAVLEDILVDGGGVARLQVLEIR